ncbi:hypothetical protein, partial [Marivirga aurantiaca]
QPNHLMQRSKHSALSLGVLKMYPSSFTDYLKSMHKNNTPQIFRLIHNITLSHHISPVADEPKQSPVPTCGLT